MSSLAGGGGGHRTAGTYRTNWRRGSARLRLRYLGSGRPLGEGGSFIFSLLNCLEHVARLRNSRPVDLLLRLAVCGLRRPGAVLPTALKVLAHPLSFIFFERAGVCFFL